MGLFNKVKSILFEEENVEIPVINKDEEEEITEEIVAKKETKKEPKKFDFEEEEVISEKKIEFEDIKPKKKDFDFPIVFDEDEFETRSSRKSNVLEYERQEKRVEKKFESPVFKPKTNQVVEEERKFKPTPVISPVFGIVDKEVNKEEYLKNKETEVIKREEKRIDVDSIRDKAYGSKLEDTKEEFFDSDLKEENKTIGDLMSMEDEEIDLDSTFIDDEPLIKDEPQESKVEDPLQALDEMEKDLSSFSKKEHDEESDTIETDLFNLIDSMYDDREEGE